MMKFIHTLEYALLIVLVVLKVSGEIDISWWLVTAPIWLLPVIQFVYGFGTTFPKSFRDSYNAAKKR